MSEQELADYQVLVGNLRREIFEYRDKWNTLGRPLRKDEVNRTLTRWYKMIRALEPQTLAEAWDDSVS